MHVCARGAAIDLQGLRVIVLGPLDFFRLIHRRTADQPVDGPVELGLLEVIAKPLDRLEGVEIDFHGREVVHGEIFVLRSISHLL